MPSTRLPDYREKNYGAGIELFITPAHGLLAGSFINSNDERSRYAGYHWRPWQRQPAGVDFSAGLAFVLIDGYSDTRALERAGAATQAARVVAAFGVKNTNRLASTMVPARK